MEFRCAGKFLEAAPILWAARLLEFRLYIFEAQFAFFAGTNILDRLLFCLLVHVHCQTTLKTPTPLSVTGGTRRNIHRRSHVVLLSERSSKRKLFSELSAVDHDGLPAGRLLIAHVENLLAGADKLFWCAMTLQAPLHLQGCELIHQRHLVDRAVARIAADSLVHMNAVIEIDKVGELVDASPFKRFIGAETFANRFKQCSVRPNLRVAIDTCLGRRNSCEARCLNRSMTITTINSQAGHMVLMTEGHGLRLRDSGIRDVRRALDLCHGPKQRCDNKHGTINGSPRQRIGTAMKDLHGT